jgi:hypothetical protein
MKFIQAITSAFKPRYEVDSERYYSTFLKQDDARLLRRFVTDIGDRISIPSAILAVGSSVFPLSHWKGRKKLNLEVPGLDAAESYQDIDLLVVPHTIVPLQSLELALKKTLSRMSYTNTAHNPTTAGVAYCNAQVCGADGIWKKTIAPYLHLDYGLHSLETKLTNGTKVDLILGREDLLDMSASKKIAEERKQGCAFSVLYQA